MLISLSGCRELWKQLGLAVLDIPLEKLSMNLSIDLAFLLLKHWTEGIYVVHPPYQECWLLV